MGKKFVTFVTIGLVSTKTCFGIHVDQSCCCCSRPSAVIVNHDRAIIRATCHKEDGTDSGGSFVVSAQLVVAVNPIDARLKVNRGVIWQMCCVLPLNVAITTLVTHRPNLNEP